MNKFATSQNAAAIFETLAKQIVDNKCTLGLSKEYTCELKENDPSLICDDIANGNTSVLVQLTSEPRSGAAVITKKVPNVVLKQDSKQYT